MLSHLVAIWIVIAILGSSAVFALAWAVRHRQFSDPDEAARSIFEPGELEEPDD